MRYYKAKYINIKYSKKCYLIINKDIFTIVLVETSASFSYNTNIKARFYIREGISINRKLSNSNRVTYYNNINFQSRSKVSNKLVISKKLVKKIQLQQLISSSRILSNIISSNKESKSEDKDNISSNFIYKLLLVSRNKFIDNISRTSNILVSSRRNINIAIAIDKKV